MTDDAPQSEGSQHDDSPEDMLGDVWDALDVLPAARSTPSLASSTIEMAAVSVAGRGQSSRSSTDAAVDGRRRWIVASLIVAASLTAGLLTGSSGSARRLPRPPELAVVIKHLETLQEAGSVAFLEAFSKGDYTLPFGRDGRRGRSDGPENGSDSDANRSEPAEPRVVPARELDAALSDFRLAFVDGEPVPPPPSEMDGDLLDEPEEAVQQFELNRLIFNELPPSQRDAYVSLAEELVNPQRSDLVDAARLWHGWVTFADPVERAGLVELPMNERLEWLDRRMWQLRRFMPGRTGDGDRSDGRPGSPGRGGSGRGPGGPPRPPRG